MLKTHKTFALQHLQNFADDTLQQAQLPTSTVTNWETQQHQQKSTAKNINKSSSEIHLSYQSRRGTQHCLIGSGSEFPVNYEDG